MDEEQPPMPALLTLMALKQAQPDEYKIRAIKAEAVVEALREEGEMLSLKVDELQAELAEFRGPAPPAYQPIEKINEHTNETEEEEEEEEEEKDDEEEDAEADEHEVDDVLQEVAVVERRGAGRLRLLARVVDGAAGVGRVA